MESARSRLAVAIAAEGKTTPRERWHDYLATEDRVRRCVREIRRSLRGNTGRSYGWLRALALLKQPLSPVDPRSHGEAQQLSQRLSEVLKVIENRTEDS
jgi:hypothetical protein